MRIGFPQVSASLRFGAASGKRSGSADAPVRFAAGDARVDEKYAQLAGTLFKAKFDSIQGTKIKYQAMDIELNVEPKVNQATVSVTPGDFEVAQKMLKELMTEGLQMKEEFSDQVRYKFYPMGLLKTVQPLNVTLMPDKVVAVKPLSETAEAEPVGETPAAVPSKPERPQLPLDEDDFLNL